MTNNIKNNQEFEALFAKARSVGLSADERSSELARLKLRMQSEPAAAVAGAAPISVWDQLRSLTPGFVSYVYRLPTKQRQTVLIAACLVVFLLAGSATSFAAGDALPGDLLYPVKIHVKEGLQSLLAVTPQARAEVETAHASERLAEAQELADQGRLTPQAQAAIQENFNENAAAVAENAKTLDAQGDAKAAAAVRVDFQARTAAKYPAAADILHAHGIGGRAVATTTNTSTSSSSPAVHRQYAPKPAPIRIPTSTPTVRGIIPSVIPLIKGSITTASSTGAASSSLTDSSSASSSLPQTQKPAKAFIVPVPPGIPPAPAPVPAAPVTRAVSVPKIGI